MAEELALQQRLRDGGAIHGHEGPFAAQAVVMDGLGRQLFPCPAFAGDEDIRRAVRHAADQLEDLLHRLALAENLMEAVFLVDGSAELADFATQRRFAQRLFHRQDHFIRLHRLDEIVIGPELHGLNGALHRPEGGHQDHIDIRIGALDLRQQFVSLHAGHA